MAKKNKEISNIELQSLLSNQIQNALGYLGGQLSDSRTKSLEYYLGDKLGTEIDGRSQVVSTDVADTIESLLPNLLRVFTASDKVVHHPESKIRSEIAIDTRRKNASSGIFGREPDQWR